MFNRRKNSSIAEKDNHQSYPDRFCHLYISSKYKQILFVPYGKMGIGAHAEIDDIIVDTWPCDFGQLQANIEATLAKFAPAVNYVKGKWPSYEVSKAKSQRAYESDYIRCRLATDQSRPYGDGEAERITVTANPTSLDITYSLVGTSHLLNTGIAQIVVDIAAACDKIRL
jgi:hypothetical protein